MPSLQSFRQWIELLVVLAIGAFLLFHFVISPKIPTINLPGMPSVKVNTKQFDEGIQRVLNHIQDQNTQINNLESEIRQLQGKVTSEAIPEALAEKDVRKSIDRMKETW